MPENDHKSILDQYKIESGFITLPLTDFLPLLNNSISYVLKLSKPENSPDNAILMNEEEARIYIQVSIATFYELRSEKKIAFVKAGRTYFYLKSSLDRYLSEKSLKKEVFNG